MLKKRLLISLKFAKEWVIKLFGYDENKFLRTTLKTFLTSPKKFQKPKTGEGN